MKKAMEHINRMCVIDDKEYEMASEDCLEPRRLASTGFYLL